MKSRYFANQCFYLRPKAARRIAPIIVSDPPTVVTNPSEIRNPPNEVLGPHGPTGCECERKRNSAKAEGHRSVLSQTLHAFILAGLSKATFTTY